VEHAPGLGAADIALTEIAKNKLTFESTFGQNGTAEAPARVVLFPGVSRAKKLKKLPKSKICAGEVGKAPKALENNDK